MPTQFTPKNILDPYADYDAAALFTELAAAPPPRVPGVHFEYSNLGPGLLGEVLGRRLGQGYEAAVRARVLEPLAPQSPDVVTGDYKIAGGPRLLVRRGANGLTVQLEGQPALPVLAESPTAFFSQGVDAQIDFVLDPKGRPVQLVLHQNGHDTPADRVAGVPAAP